MVRNRGEISHSIGMNIATSFAVGRQRLQQRALAYRSDVHKALRMVSTQRGDESSLRPRRSDGLRIGRGARNDFEFYPTRCMQAVIGIRSGVAQLVVCLRLNGSEESSDHVAIIAGGQHARLEFAARVRGHLYERPSPFIESFEFCLRPKHSEEPTSRPRFDQSFRSKPRASHWRGAGLHFQSYASDVQPLAQFESAGKETAAKLLDKCVRSALDLAPSHAISCRGSHNGPQLLCDLRRQRIDMRL